MEQIETLLDSHFAIIGRQKFNFYLDGRPLGNTAHLCLFARMTVICIFYFTFSLIHNGLLASSSSYDASIFVIMNNIIESRNDPKRNAKWKNGYYLLYRVWTWPCPETEQGKTVDESNEMDTDRKYKVTKII